MQFALTQPPILAPLAASLNGLVTESAILLVTTLLAITTSVIASHKQPGPVSYPITALAMDVIADVGLSTSTARLILRANALSIGAQVTNNP